MKDKKGTNILIFVGWLSVIFAVVTPSILLGLIAFCMGLVLKKDYEEKQYGIVFMILGIMSGISGYVIGPLLIWYIEKAL
jgi:FtsH-binding integral membrane protein